MKLRSRDGESLTFELNRRERELLVFLLRRYPVLDPAYHQIAKPSDRESLAAEQQLLTESMTGEQKTNRQLVEAFINTRLTPEASKPAGPLPVRLTLAEADWLLRIINDVRVGSWVRLDRPEDHQLHSPLLAARNVTDFTAMELGGLVQQILLQALRG